MFRFPSRKKDGTNIFDDKDFAKRTYESLNSRGWCIFYAYCSIENKLRPFEFALEMQAAGLIPVDVVIITRPWFGGKKSDTHLSLGYEYAFIFSKHDNWFLDRIPVNAVLSSDKHDLSACPGNSWFLKDYNPAEIYASDLAAAIMKMTGLLPGSVVFDPLMGGSGGLEAAVACGHSFIGFEQDMDKYNKYPKVLKRLEKGIKIRDKEHNKSGDDDE